MTARTGRAGRCTQSHKIPPERGNIRIDGSGVLPGNEPFSRVQEPEKRVSSLLKFYTQRALSKIDPRKILKQKLHRSRKTRRNP